MRPDRSRRVAASVATALILMGALAGSTLAQGGLGGLVPGVVTKGAPDWVQLGTRATFYTAGASIANADYQWQEDENGTWQDPVTGKRYGQTDAATASGEGYFQVDVIGIDGPDVALQWVLFGLDRTAGRFFGGSAGGAREPGAAPEDLWLHPALLADIPEANLPDLLILRGDYTVEGNTYHGLGIVNPNRNMYSSQIYDLETGLLLSSTTNTKANASPFHVQGQDPPEGNTQLTIVRIAGVRQRDAAGMDAPIPAWATPGTVLRYAGTWTFVNPYDPGGAPAIYPVQSTVTLSAGGPTWLTYRADSVVDFAGLPNTSQGAGIAGGTGPYWIAPDVLAHAREGQVIDEDPITGQRLTVTWVGSGPNGQAVTIGSEVAGLPSSATYDMATGVLLAATRTEVGAGITINIQLQSIQ